jgi:DNA-binding winged helix-turn-helix (wHTH) protein
MAIYRFGDFEADEGRFMLRRRGRNVRVQRLVLETLFYFLRSGGQLITKRDLALGTRSGATVSDAAVSRTIMLARKAIMDRAGEVIVTVHGVGYRFESEVQEALGPEPEAAGQVLRWPRAAASRGAGSRACSG